MQKFETREYVEFYNEGTKLFGILHRPLGEKEYPAVLFCHGLAGHKVGKHRMYVSIAECLSRVGIASFRFDFRGSGDSEGEFGEMTLEGEVRDAVKAFEFLSEQPGVDATRIGAYGRSFGGAIAVMASHRFDNIKSLVLWAPVFNGEQWEEQWEKVQSGKVDEERRHELMRINGQMPSLNFYGELIRLSLGDEILSLQNIPMLLIHGKKDPIVNIEHSNKFLALRENASATTEFIKLPHSDHDFSHPEEKFHAINHTCQWFAKTL